MKYNVLYYKCTLINKVEPEEVVFKYHHSEKNKVYVETRRKIGHFSSNSDTTCYDFDTTKIIFEELIESGVYEFKEDGCLEI